MFDVDVQIIKYHSHFIINFSKMLKQITEVSPIKRKKFKKINVTKTNIFDYVVGFLHDSG